MKSLNLIPALFISLILFTSSSCNPEADVKDKICDKWYFHDLDYENIDTEDLNRLKDDEDWIGVINYIRFKNDNTFRMYRVTSPEDSESLKGEWAYDPEKEEIVLEPESGRGDFEISLTESDEDELNFSHRASGIDFSYEMEKERSKREATDAYQDLFGGPQIFILGTWTLDNIDADLSDMPSEQQEQAKKMLDELEGKMIFTFNEDNSYSSSMEMMGETIESTGKWELSEDGKILKTVKRGSTKIDEITLSELSRSKMVIVQEMGGQETAMTFVK